MLFARFGLEEGDTRPIVKGRLFGKECLMMIDSGAKIPVWTAPERVLWEYGLKPNKRGAITGFGGEVEGNIYRFPLFCFGDFTFNNLPVIAIDQKDSKYDFLLSINVFYDLSVNIDYTLNKLIVTSRFDDKQSYRNLVVSGRDGKRHVFSNDYSKQ